MPENTPHEGWTRQKDAASRALHDFRNALMVLVEAAQLGDKKLTNYWLLELERMFICAYARCGDQVCPQACEKKLKGKDRH